MDATPLYDLAPIARIALLGVALAAAPLAWVWWRHRHGGPGDRARALMLVTLFLTFDLVIFGAFTRLTDSGLGCPDWPGCYGSVSPIGAQEEIHAAQSAQPLGPVTFSKAWIEMIHRYLATGVGVLITVLTILAWREWRHQRGRGPAAGDAALSPLWATATLFWVCMQGAFGALTVTMKLYPAIVVAHLLGGLGLLALLAAQAQAQRPAPMRLPVGLRWAAVVVAGLTLMQIALGGWVSTNYAVLACTDFPTCHGRWWPAMDFEHGFAILRELGQGKDGGALPFEALTAIHYAHRLFAVVVVFGLGGLAWVLHRAGREGTPAASRFAAALAGLAVLQLASGVSNVVLGWPLLAALGHTGGAAALVVVLTLLLARAFQPMPVVATLSSPAGRDLRASRLHHV